MKRWLTIFIINKGVHRIGKQTTNLREGAETNKEKSRVLEKKEREVINKVQIILQKDEKIGKLTKDGLMLSNGDQKNEIDVEQLPSKIFIRKK